MGKWTNGIKISILTTKMQLTYKKEVAFFSLVQSNPKRFNQSS